MTKNRVTGLVSLVLGVIYLIATSRIELTAVSDPIGPRAFPYIIGTGLVLLGLALVLKREALTSALVTYGLFFGLLDVSLPRGIPAF